MIRLYHRIAGDLMASTSGEWLDGVCPATGEVTTHIARGDAADVDLAVAAAKAAQPVWAATPLEARARLLDRIADTIEADLDAFARTESEDQGKPVSLAQRVDIPRAVANFRTFAALVRSECLPATTNAQGWHLTMRQPVGVVGMITPWNLPLYLLSWKLAPALALGNGVVAKPSELTPRTADRLWDVFDEVGLPSGVANLVHGLGTEAGARLVAHPDVSAISFTGGTATGRLVAASAAPAFKKLSLELGGKNASLILPDADLPRAIAGVARAAFTNQGEICLCGSRVLVHVSQARAVIDGLKAAAQQRVVGDPSDPRVDLGALISAAHRDKVASYLRRARQEGGEVFGGEQPVLPAPFSGGFYLNPAVISGLPADSCVATEEIFGPVVSVHTYQDVDEAVRIANAVRYGLSASVWGQDSRVLMTVAEQLRVGMVWINGWMVRDLRTPFGGTKDSGVGREGGTWSLDTYSELKSVTWCRD